MPKYPISSHVLSSVIFVHVHVADFAVSVGVALVNDRNTTDGAVAGMDISIRWRHRWRHVVNLGAIAVVVSAAATAVASAATAGVVSMDGDGGGGDAPNGEAEMKNGGDDDDGV